LPFQRNNTVRRIDFTFQNGFVLPLTITGFAVGIKMSKNFYLQLKHNEQLAKQKIEAEVQLLKSQIHPRFLFHSLNSIYNDMLNGAKHSPEMLLKLSELLSYILYESDKIMTLEKELLLLQNYISLEQISWRKNLTVQINKTIETSGLYIEPLLLLPLAEYIFMYADKNKKQKLFLNIYIQVKQQSFQFDIESSSKFEVNNLKENIQLLQVQKRLHTQYADRHKFNITHREDNIAISLLLELKNELSN